MNTRVACDVVASFVLVFSGMAVEKLSQGATKLSDVSEASWAIVFLTALVVSVKTVHSRIGPAK